uniref:Uncharacterized protein n=1 Tax=Timema cristinae TaxID=61476 RepID=A0A7R9D398_TIMCR|nr:unnamed protein product [Timema cristinae]
MFAPRKWKTLSTPDRDSNLDFLIIGSLVYGEISALDHAATEAASGSTPRMDDDDTGTSVQLHVYDLTNGMAAMMSQMLLDYSVKTDGYS